MFYIYLGTIVAWFILRWPWLKPVPAWICYYILFHRCDRYKGSQHDSNPNQLITGYSDYTSALMSAFLLAGFGDFFLEIDWLIPGLCCFILCQLCFSLAIGCSRKGFVLDDVYEKGFGIQSCYLMGIVGTCVYLITTYLQFPYLSGPLITIYSCQLCWNLILSYHRMRLWQDSDQFAAVWLFIQSDILVFLEMALSTGYLQYIGLSTYWASLYIWTL